MMNVNTIANVEDKIDSNGDNCSIHKLISIDNLEKEISPRSI